MVRLPCDTKSDLYRSLSTCAGQYLMGENQDDQHAQTAGPTPKTDPNPVLELGKPKISKKQREISDRMLVKPTNRQYGLYHP